MQDKYQMYRIFTYTYLEIYSVILRMVILIMCVYILFYYEVMLFVLICRPKEWISWCQEIVPNTVFYYKPLWINLYRI